MHHFLWKTWGTFSLCLLVLGAISAPMTHVKPKEAESLRPSEGWFICSPKCLLILGNVESSITYKGIKNCLNRKSKCMALGRIHSLQSLWLLSWFLFSLMAHHAALYGNFNLSFLPGYLPPLFLLMKQTISKIKIRRATAHIRPMNQPCVAISTCRLAIAGKQINGVSVNGLRERWQLLQSLVVKKTAIVHKLFHILHVAPPWNLSVINQELHKYLTLKNLQ